MTLGRTSSGAIKIKTDGGLRAVGCACCGGSYGFPCADCPPFLGDLNFAVSGDQLDGLIEFQYPTVVCPSEDCNYTNFPNIPPRICSDSYDAFQPRSPGALDNKLVMVNLNRSFVLGCSWELGFQVSGLFYFTFGDMEDICSVNWGGSKYITNLDPRGSYNFQASAQCDYMGGPATEFNFTVTVT